MTTYTSVYPPAHTDTYVKATSKASTNYWPYYATDPTKSLTGASSMNAWASANGTVQNRFHIDLGSAKIIRRVYYENYHNSGIEYDRAAKAFTLMGSNDSSAFSTLTYGTDTGWTALTTAVSQFDQHAASDAADPKYFLVTNMIGYRYYAFKISTCWSNTYTCLRRVELQTEDGFGFLLGPTWF